MVCRKLTVLQYDQSTMIDRPGMWVLSGRKMTGTIYRKG